MIVVELAFSDSPARLDARPAHRERLQDLHDAGELLAAGPWSDDTGAILLFTGDLAAVRALLAADPYFTTDGVTVTEMRDWRPVVGP